MGGFGQICLHKYWSRAGLRIRRELTRIRTRPSRKKQDPDSTVKKTLMAWKKSSIRIRPNIFFRYKIKYLKHYWEISCLGWESGWSVSEVSRKNPGSGSRKTTVFDRHRINKHGTECTLNTQHAMLSPIYWYPTGKPYRRGEWRMGRWFNYRYSMSLWMFYIRWLSDKWIKRIVPWDLYPGIV